MEGTVLSEDTRFCVCAVVPPEDGHVKAPKHVEDSNVTYMLLLNCALKLVEEIIPVQICVA